MIYVFFFFKQKTAYEISVRDWSSDVCSSDLGGPPVACGGEPARRRGARVETERHVRGRGGEGRTARAPLRPCEEPARGTAVARRLRRRGGAGGAGRSGVPARRFSPGGRALRRRAGARTGSAGGAARGARRGCLGSGG